MASAPQLYWPYPPDQVGTWIWGYQGHQGTDWPKPTGTPIPATSDGVIVFAGDDGLGALTIDLQRADGLVQRFGHLSSIWVKVGQRVAAGNAIGLVGSTGNSTGPHLHWELRWDRLWNGGRVVDPRTLNPQIFGAVAPQRKDPDMARILNMRETPDGKNNSATIFLDGGPGVGIVGIKSPAHLTLLQRFITDKPGDHMYPAELAIVQSYLVPAGDKQAAVIEKAVAAAVAKHGVKVDSAALAKDVAKQVNDDAAKRMQS